MKTFFAATLALSAIAGDASIRARWAAQRDIASMARDLEDCFPTGQLGNSIWRPTTIVKPGRVWAEAGQGPSSRVDCDGKEVGESRLVFPTYKKGATTRTAGYSYDRTLLETRQPARCSYGYAMPYYGCTYGYGCGYQQPSYSCGGKTVDARGYGECKECEDYPRGLAYGGCKETVGSAFEQGPDDVPVKRNPTPYIPMGYEAEADYNWQGTVHDQPSHHSRPVGRYNWTFNDFNYARNGILDVNGRKGYSTFYECEGIGCPDCKDQTGTLLQDLLNRLRKDDCKDCSNDWSSPKYY